MLDRIGVFYVKQVYQRRPLGIEVDARSVEQGAECLVMRNVVCAAFINLAEDLLRIEVPASDYHSNPE